MRIFDRCRQWAGTLLNSLNALGLALLLYVSQNPSAPSELYDLFPEALRPIARVVIPVIWFLVVQKATKRLKAQDPAP